MDTLKNELILDLTERLDAAIAEKNDIEHCLHKLIKEQLEVIARLIETL